MPTSRVRFILILFLNLWTLLVPLSYRVFKIHDNWLNTVLHKPLNTLTQFCFGVSANSVLTSDSTSLYLWTLILLICSLIIGIVLLLKIPKLIPTLTIWMQKIALYFLVLQLMRYGFDKVFKAQFYLPEPNILATELGNLDKDILFWSTMGASYSYNLFMGFTEVLAAVLLIFRKTRVLGLLISLGVILQILAINISFDISVKLFSSILLLTSLLLLSPFLKALYSFLFQGKLTKLPKSQKLNLKKWNTPLKLIVVSLILIECVLPFIISGNFNDDNAQRPFLHGIYLNTANNAKIKRLFVHRDGYLIFENQKGVKTDFALQVNEIKKELKITNYNLKTTNIPYNFSQNKILILTIKGKELMFTQQDWKNLPLLQDQWHWTVDGGF